jgi:cytoskeletal protein CcmA (bactofilin family)
MKTFRRILLLTTILMIFALPSAAFAGEFFDQVVFSGTYTLRSGETLDGNLVVLGGTVNIEENALVNGEVLAMGGSIFIDGEVDGNLTALGGLIRLGETAFIDGDLVSIGALVQRDEGSVVEGQVITETDFPFQISVPSVDLTPPFEFTSPSVFMPRFMTQFNPLREVTWFLFRTFMISALAMLVVMFLPKQTEEAANTIIKEPVVTGGIGLLSIVAIPILLIMLSLTLILIPFTLLGSMVYVLALLFGWIILGHEVGRRFAQMLNREWTAPIVAGLGTFGLTFVALSLTYIPCIGWIVFFLIASIGLGTVILTRFGTQAFPVVGLVPADEGASPEDVIVDVEEPAEEKPKARGKKKSE